MYVNPVFLPQVSNREDFLTTVSIFDDDTGQAIKLDGCTTALSVPFTGAVWTVTDGAIVTSSTTVLGIPVFPINSASLTALSLTVGVGLTIAAGDPITIADATGLNRMTGYVMSYSASTGALVCQIGAAFRFEIRRGGPHNDGSGYVPWYDFGTPGECGSLLAATLGQGISIIDIGVIQVRIPAVTFQKLSGGTYSASLIFSDGIDTRQVYVGQLPVIQSHMSTLPISATVQSSGQSSLFTLGLSRLG
jgi:hypothetical protein